MSIIRLTVPGALAFRNVALHAVHQACPLVGYTGGDTVPAANASPADGRIEIRDSFETSVVTAFQEIFNNIAMHAYGGNGSSDDIDIQIEVASDRLTITITDHGTSFDISTIPLPDALPEGGMGIYLAREALDELDYEPGPPNVWTLVKYRDASDEPAAAPQNGRADV